MPIGDKYIKLRKHLENCGLNEITMTFEQIANIVGGLPKSAYDYTAPWYDSHGGPLAQCWLKAGYTASSVVCGKQVTFTKRGIVREEKKDPMPSNAVNSEHISTNLENVMLRITRDNVDSAYAVYVRGHYDRAEKLLHDILADPLFRYNTDERIVAMKIGLIDTLYSTNLNKGQSTTSLPDLASAIARPEIRFDERILCGDVSVVADVLKGARNNFSFVSKYCKIHEYYLSETDNFAIYDSVVSKNLFRFLPHYGGLIMREHTPQNTCFQKRDYALWCDYINKVIEINDLQDIPKIKRKLDWYIWGKFNSKDK